MPKEKSASGASRELIHIHREWILGLSAQLGLTPTQIAKQAGLVATTTTRIVSNPDHPNALSSTTIDKIVRKFGVSPPISPDFKAFREAVGKTIAALHRHSALQAATPDDVAHAIIELSDWLAKSNGKGVEQLDGVVSFEAERLRRIVPRETKSGDD